MSNLPQDRHGPIVLCLWGTVVGDSTAMYSDEQQIISLWLTKGARQDHQGRGEANVRIGSCATANTHHTDYKFATQVLYTSRERTMAVGRITITL